MRIDAHINKQDSRRGFTLVELMVVVAIIAVVAGIAIPNLLESKKVVNEKSIVPALRAIHSAETILLERHAIDADNDEAGEYGDLLQLAANVQLDMAPDATGLCERNGYLYRVYLPSADAGMGVDDDESMYLAVAWPKKYGKTGEKAYFVDDRGQVFFHANAGGAWDGVGAPVLLADVFVAAFVPGNYVAGWTSIK